MLKPLNNHCLIEVIDEYDGIIRDKQNEQVQKGVLRAAEFVADHLTASAGYEITQLVEIANHYDKLVGKTVYWQEYADAGSKFEFDGKKYCLVPFYRLVGYED
jgi:co-chaperonin GroES (HSP10)